MIVDIPADPLPITWLDPFAEPGLWLVKTASGSSYLIDTRDQDRAPRVRRSPVDAPVLDDDGLDDGERFVSVSLRCDRRWLPLVSVGWLDDDTWECGHGLQVGKDALLELGGVRSDGRPVPRQATPVVSIEPVSQS